MALKIQLRKNQKIIINGAVLENASHRSISLLVINDAAILRDNDILTPEQAVTPASRVYYALQCLYLFPQDSEKYLPLFRELLESYEEAAPSATDVGKTMREAVDKGNFYQALKKGQELISHEHGILADVEEKLSRELRTTTPSGQPETD